MMGIISSMQRSIMICNNAMKIIWQIMVIYLTIMNTTIHIIIHTIINIIIMMYTTNIHNTHVCNINIVFKNSLLLHNNSFRIFNKWIYNALSNSSMTNKSHNLRRHGVTVGVYPHSPCETSSASTKVSTTGTLKSNTNTSINIHTNTNTHMKTCTNI